MKFRDIKDILKSDGRTKLYGANFIDKSGIPVWESYRHRGMWVFVDTEKKTFIIDYVVTGT